MSANDSDTVDTLDTLTPEERAAIDGDEYGDEDREIIKKDRRRSLGRRRRRG